MPIPSVKFIIDCIQTELNTFVEGVAKFWRNFLSSATCSDLFGQGEQFSKKFCIFLMKEGLYQKIAPRK